MTPPSSTETVSVFFQLRNGVFCLVVFLLAIAIGVTKLPWHYYRFRKYGEERSKRFLYRFMKSLDQAACAGAFGGKSDETVSNRAGSQIKAFGLSAPLWAIVTQWITERWEPNHVVEAIEPTRRDFWDDPPTETP